MAFSYTLEKTDSTTAARAGRMVTAHGTVHTPAFMPVGTAGSVKSLTPDELEAAGAEIILANTYHLSLRPGAETVRLMGGMHRFMNWPGVILTDSGGFQVMSLATLRKVKDEGVEFRSHLDGSVRRLGPEDAVRIQDALGTDIAMSLDELIELPASADDIRRAADRTVAWAGRGLAERARLRGEGGGAMALFGINQGGTDAAERARCYERLAGMPFDGFALGGLWVGEGLKSNILRLIFSISPFPIKLTP